MRDCLLSGTPAAIVRVGQALGSTPREEGAAMLVTANAVQGTVGGGRLEWHGIEAARALIAGGEREARLAVPLGPRIGQCCGGHVTLHLRAVTEAALAEEEEQEARERASLPVALLFGAGHTGRAVAEALSPLPIRLRVVDSRPEALEGLPPGVERLGLAIPEAAVASAPPRSAFLVMTHDHPLDFLLAAAALRRGDASYVGMIGSATKRETFRRALAETGEEALVAGLTLPVGGSGLRDKRPAVIAALTAAEVAVCLLSNQQESLPDRLAGADPGCHSDGVRRTG
ncbi:xanthine dehydrogenase accessory protein XdhC [Aureimonas leprariae]|uniref:Xanthine dehydrogenase accessory protein XdhC n=1 Tax=Plantimonas leprariae TaxID=2615207 RepID=A0A7V7PNY4_9HYPH|nr:xanthine dehydrogenase accessory protein XdhC [Aureimonas leprariae]